MDDILNDVVQPCARLQAMSLPREGGAAGLFLIPPGPTPFSFDVTSFLQGRSVAPSITGDNITIRVGNFLTFKSVIILNTKVVFDNRLGVKGPVGATVDVTFETY